MTADKLREALALVEAHDGKPDDHAFVHDITALMLDAYGSHYSEVCGLYELACSGGLNALGAVVALVEREMPGFYLNMQFRSGNVIDTEPTGCSTTLWQPGQCKPTSRAQRLDSYLALALLAAYLRALIAEAELAGQRAGKAS